MEARKVKAEIVRETPFKETTIGSLLFRFKLTVAIVLDGIDFFIANIPMVNEIWDIITFFVLMLLLKRKYLAYLSLGELLIPGIPPLGFIDGLIPIATVLVLVERAMEKVGI